VTVVAVVPAYGLADERALNADCVLAHLRREGLQTLTVASLNGGSPAHARNLGAELARRERPDLDVLVFNDADSLVPGRQILEAVVQARRAPGLVYAFDLYCRLSAGASAGVRDAIGDGAPVGLMSVGVEEELVNAPSAGCVAISAQEFAEAGGFDQRFVGWGYEDVEFAQRCAKRFPVRRVSGPLYHLWHGGRRPDDAPADTDPVQVERNRRLWLSTV
jgi:hypothetical protein